MKSTRLFVFEIVWHIEYQIDMLNTAIRLTTDKKRKNIYSKELGRYAKLKKKLNKISDKVLFTADSTNNVKEYLSSNEFMSQLERIATQ